MTIRKIIGIVLAAAAVLFCFAIPLVSIFTYSMPYEFTKKFVSAWECYWYRNDGFLLINQGVGILFGIGGVRCLATDFNRRKLGWVLLAACGVILLWNVAASLAIGIDTWNLDENLHWVYRTFFSYYFSENGTYLLILGGMLLFPLLIGVDLLEKKDVYPSANNRPIF